LFKEWKGCSSRTRVAISVALLVLVAAVVMLTYGNWLGDQVVLPEEPVPAAEVAP
jgi:hypothetical protein